MNGEKVVPARITWALDACELYGPQVDEACGAQEPAVDLWELGELQPTPEQLARLAELTGKQVGWFFLPVTAGVQPQVFVCTGPRRKCHAPAPDVITEAGVLLPEGKTRPRPKPAQQALF